MADNHSTSFAAQTGTTAKSTSDLTTSQLRALAQSHLLEIQEDIQTEAQAQLQTQTDLQKYTKQKRKEQTRSQASNNIAAALTSSAKGAIAAADAEMTKGPKLRSAGDVLDRLRWDPSIKIDEYFVGYLERFEGIKEMPVRNWIRESTDEEFIPQHRIKWVKRRWEGSEEVVWHREARIDRLFGSGANTPHSDKITTADMESVADSVDGGAYV